MPETCQICNPSFTNPTCRQQEARYGCENLEPRHRDHHCKRTLEHYTTGGHAPVVTIPMENVQALRNHSLAGGTDA